MKGQLLPAWISAIAAVASLILGLLAGATSTGAYFNKKVSSLEQAIEILETPGKNPKVEAGFEFRLDSYRFHDRQAIVDLLVTSLETDKKLRINSQSRLIDEFGQVYNPAEIQFGGKSGSNATVDLPADVPVRLVMKFDNISSKTKGFKYLEIATSKPTITFPSGDFADLLIAQQGNLK